MSSALRPDLDGMLVALVLVPSTYSRNRYFDLYSDPAARRVRRRASLVRSIIAQLAAKDALRKAKIVQFEPVAEGQWELVFEVPALGFRRTVLLEPLELSLIRFALAHANAPSLDAMDTTDPDRRLIEQALIKLGPVADGGAEPVESGAEGL